MILFILDSRFRGNDNVFAGMIRRVTQSRFLPAIFVQEKTFDKTKNICYDNVLVLLMFMKGSTRGQFGSKEGGIVMNEIEFKAMIAKSGLEGVRDWRMKNREELLDLVDARFPGTHLEDAYIPGANCGSAHMEGAHLEGAYCSEVVFVNAHLHGAHLEGAYLGRADFFHAHLHGAHFEGTNCTGANFTGAKLDGAYFQGADLQGSLCLDQAGLNGTNLQGAILPESISPKVLKEKGAIL